MNNLAYLLGPSGVWILVAMCAICFGFAAFVLLYHLVLGIANSLEGRKEADKSDDGLRDLEKAEEAKPREQIYDPA